MMSISKIKRTFLFLGSVIFSFCSCNLDYAPSMVSASIIESQKMGFFLFEYKIDSLIIFDKKKSFVVNKAWIEKAHTSTMSSLGNETFQKDSALNQIVLDLNKSSYLNSENFDNWIITNEKGDLGSLEGRMISVRLNFKETPERIRFRIYTLKKPGVFRYDTVKVAEFILKKR